MHVTSPRALCVGCVKHTCAQCVYRCTAQCAVGYAGSPTPSTTCSSSGTWTQPDGLCAQGGACCHNKQHGVVCVVEARRPRGCVASHSLAGLSSSLCAHAPLPRLFDTAPSSPSVPALQWTSRTVAFTPCVLQSSAPASLPSRCTAASPAQQARPWVVSATGHVLRGMLAALHPMPCALWLGRGACWGSV